MSDISDVIEGPIIQACFCHAIELDGDIQHLSKPYLDERFPDGYRLSHGLLSIECGKQYSGDAWDDEDLPLYHYQSCPKPTTSQETSEDPSL